MKRKLLLLVLAALLAFGVVGLAACGSESSDGGAATADAASPEAAAAKIKDSGKLRVGVKQDVPGFGLLNPETGKFEGLEIDLAKGLAERVGLTADQVEFTPVTAETRGTLLDNGQLDMVIATFTIKPERLEQWNFSDPYFTDTVGLLVEKKNGFTDLKSLNGKTIGVAQGATSKAALEEEAKKAGVTFKYLEFQTYPEISTALSAGKVDAFCVDRSILSGYLTDTREILPNIAFSPQEYGIATKKSNTGLATFVNNYIKEIKGNGELDKMIADHKLAQ